MKHLFLLGFALTVFAACQSPKESSQETPAADTTISVAPVTLTKKWETDTLLTTSESVLYDKDRDVLYVSNINGVPNVKDGNGSIAKVTLDGKVSEAKWVKGLDAPKGLGLFNGKLYVTDIDRIHEIDVASGKITKTHAVQGAKFLNDITVDANGKVYASDSESNMIVMIENGKLSKWLDVEGPNGLLAEDGKIMLALWGAKTFNTIDLSNNNQVTLRTDSIENPDGIEAIGDGSYLVSSWNGMIHHVGADGKRTTLIDTRADSVSAADIEYIQEKNLLLVPTFFKNSVVAYELKKN